MRDLSHDETIDFLTHGTRTGKLAVTLPSGNPTATPVWFVRETDGIIRFAGGHDSVKAKALRANNHAALLVDLEEPPYGYVRVAGTVTFDDDHDEVVRVTRLTLARYLGRERAEAYDGDHGGRGQTVMSLQPTKITAVTEIAT